MAIQRTASDHAISPSAPRHEPLHVRTSGRRISLSFTGLDEARNRPDLKAYSALSNISLLSLSNSAPTVLRAVLYTQMSFAHIHVPSFALRWPRDRRSIRRTSVLLVRSGQLDINTSTGIVKHGAGVALIPPGTSPIDIAGLAPMTELVYFTAPASFLEGLRLTDEGHEHADAGTENFAPIYGFVSALCAATGNAAAFEDLAENTVRSALGMIAGRPDQHDLFDKALAIIDRDYVSEDFSPAHLAVGLDVSLRKVQSVFREHGTSVSREIRNRRAHAARGLKAANPDVSFETIAAMVGFGSRTALFRALSDTESRLSSDSLQTSA